MMNVSRSIAGAVALAAVAMLPATASFAQQNAIPNIAVPTPGPGPGHPAPPQQSFEGCYYINQDLYGPYRMSFCLSRWGGGSYHVTGGGLNCNGNLNWSDRGGEARVNIHYSWCGRGVGWSADTMVCSPMQGPWQPGGGGFGNQPRIAVPVPVSQDLRCAYYPGVRGFDAVSVIATKTQQY